MTDETHPSQQTELSQADAQAIDALIDARFDLSRVPGNHKPRAANASNLLSLLAGDCKINPALVNVTLARVQRAGSPGHVEEVEAVLCDEDKEALDAYVAAEFRAGRVASSLRARADQVEAMVQLVSQTGTANAAPGLVDRTMRRIATTQDQDLQPIPIRSFGGFRFADLVSVAAVLLMGVAVLWPILSTVKTYQQKGSCEANFGTIASALTNYSGDNRGVLPVATASYGGNWMNVGTTPEQSNSSNLFTLAKSGYASLRNLACAGNSHAVTEAPKADAKDWNALPEVSYSYYIMFGKPRPTLETSGRTVILADKSPAVVRAANHEPIQPHENSPNHGGRGQFALFADGSVAWLTSPDVGGDNIWLNRQQEEFVREFEKILPKIMANAPKGATGVKVTVQMPVMRGDELPDSQSDTILGP
jgi:hypothetical protein